MSITIPDGLPRLAAGSHQRGSGKACAMNYVSYINGDVRITDEPHNVNRELARHARHVNDIICPCIGDTICGDCSGVLLRAIPRLIGTGPLPSLKNTELRHRLREAREDILPLYTILGVGHLTRRAACEAFLNRALEIYAELGGEQTTTITGADMTAAAESIKVGVA